MAYTFNDAVNDLRGVQFTDNTHREGQEAYRECLNILLRLNTERLVEIRDARQWSAAWKAKAKELRANLGLVGRIRELTNEPLIEADYLDDDDLFDDADDPYSGMEDV